MRSAASCPPCTPSRAASSTGRWWMPNRRKGVETAVGPDTFLVIEKWASLADLQAHSASSHMQAYGERVGHLVEGRAVHVLQDA